jgi:molybdate transport system substrate-binding protein
MRKLSAFALLAALAMSVAAGAQSAQPEIRVLSPGVTTNSGLRDFADQFGKANNVKVTIVGSGMGRIVADAKSIDPPPDVLMLPLELMASLSLDGGIVGAWTPLGRTEMGLAVPAGKPHPDISTVEKLAAALRSAKAVMRSNPAGGSMVASVIENNVIKRPEFAGVNSPVSTKGEGGQALARGEGDMALQAICEILPYKEIELVGKLPRELRAWIDMSTAVSARSKDPKRAAAFIQFITRPEAAALWKSKGLDRF